MQAPDAEQRLAADQSRHKPLWLWALGILLFLFCYRIWGLGPTHTDDAGWLLAAHEGDWSVIGRFARSQGRIWAFVSGLPLYVSVALTDTWTGEILRAGSAALFFGLFYRLWGIFFGLRFAALAGALNLGLYALRWDGSMATTYPGLFWIIGVIYLVSVLLGLRFVENGNAKYRAASLALFFVCLFVHESVASLFVALYIMTMASYAAMRQPTAGLAGLLKDRRSAVWRILLPMCGVIAVYGVLYLAWRFRHPSSYSGNVLRAYSLSSVLPIMLTFATSGTLLHDLWFPYQVGFADAVTQSGYKVSYKVLSFLKLHQADPAAWVQGFCVGGVVWTVGCRQ